jgi:hypothetical protein
MADERRARDEANRRGFAHAANNTFGLLRSEGRPVEGGWREARVLDGDFAGWLCQHVHATAQDAEDCPDKQSISDRDPEW